MTENTNIDPVPNENIPSSLLNEILSTADQSQSEESWDFPQTDTGGVNDSGENMDAPLIIPASINSVTKKKIAMKPRDFLKILGAILLVALIFFGAFLAYIVFNPGQAQFFISFGINPWDISSLLQRLVGGIFGIFTFVFSVVWIVFLFRAIITKKEYRKKKTIAIIFSVFVGILLFSEISLWAFLVQKIDATDYQNPNGGVLIYDNDKLLSKQYASHAQLTSFDNLIGPLILKFDLKSDANLVAKMMNIEDYEIDFDGGKCRGTESSIIKGVNPQNDGSIICIFDSVKTYKPSGVYRGTDKVTRKKKTFPIVFNPMNVVGVVKIKTPQTPREHAFTYDASDILHLGNIAWYTEKNGNTPVSADKVYSIIPETEEQVLCLSVFSPDNCDKIFVVPSQWQAVIKGKIIVVRDDKEPLFYRFHLEQVKVENGEIASYKWTINNKVVASSEDSIEYSFPEYGTQKIAVTITDSAGIAVVLEEKIEVSRPLKLVKGLHTESLLRLSDTNGKTLIEDTYSKDLGSYFVSDLTLPATLTFDATDVAVQNFWYQLSDVEWNFDDNTSYEKIGKKMQYEIVEEKRYTIRVRYSFISPHKDTPEFIIEKIIIEPTKKNILAKLEITRDSDYAPAIIHVDGSASQSKEGAIDKFVYDFWEWNGAVEGDAIQDYKYNFPGEYTLTFTIVKSDGTKEVTTRKIVLKDTPKNLLINTSISSGTVGNFIDFDTAGSAGQIESYEWSFGDGWSSQDAVPSHSYDHPGKYTIKLTAVYADKTVRRTDKEIEIK